MLKKSVVDFLSINRCIFFTHLFWHYFLLVIVANRILSIKVLLIDLLALFNRKYTPIHFDESFFSLYSCFEAIWDFLIDYSLHLFQKGGIIGQLPDFNSFSDFLHLTVVVLVQKRVQAHHFDEVKHLWYHSGVYIGCGDEIKVERFSLFVDRLTFEVWAELLCPFLQKIRRGKVSEIGWLATWANHDMERVALRNFGFEEAELLASEPYVKGLVEERAFQRSFEV